MMPSLLSTLGQEAGIWYPVVALLVGFLRSLGQGDVLVIFHIRAKKHKI